MTEFNTNDLSIEADFCWNLHQSTGFNVKFVDVGLIIWARNNFNISRVTETKYWAMNQKPIYTQFKKFMLQMF